MSSGPTPSRAARELRALSPRVHSALGPALRRLPARSPRAGASRSPQRPGPVSIQRKKKKKKNRDGGKEGQDEAEGKKFKKKKKKNIRNVYNLLEAS